MQKLYSLNKGTTVIPITMNNEVVAGQDSLYASACIDKKTNEAIVKLVNTSPKEQVNTIVLNGVKRLASQGTLIVLKGNPDDMNSFEDPNHVSPKESTIDIKGKNISLTAAPYSFNVIRVKMM